MRLVVEYCYVNTVEIFILGVKIESEFNLSLLIFVYITNNYIKNDKNVNKIWWKNVNKNWL